MTNDNDFLDLIKTTISINKKELIFKKQTKNMLSIKNVKSEKQATNYMLKYNNILHRIYFNSFMNNAFWFIVSNNDIIKVVVAGKNNYNNIC